MGYINDPLLWGNLLGDQDSTARIWPGGSNMPIYDPDARVPGQPTTMTEAAEEYRDIALEMNREDFLSWMMDSIAGRMTIMRQACPGPDSQSLLVRGLCESWRNELLAARMLPCKDEVQQ